MGYKSLRTTSLLRVLRQGSVSWERVNRVYREVFRRIEVAGLLEGRRSHEKTLLLALGGNLALSLCE